MKRQLLKSLLYAAAAIAVVGCAKSEVSDVLGESSSNTINLNTSVSATRGADVTLDDLKLSTISLYAYSETKSTSYKLDYTCTDNVWSTTSENNTWSDVEFTTSFYSAYAGGPLELATVGEESATLNYTVATCASTATKDLIYYGAEVTSMPVGGNIYAYYKHALSKLIFSTTKLSTDKLYIASVKLVNVDGAATMTLSNGGTIEWSDNDDIGATYTYYDVANPEDGAIISSTTNPIMMIPQTTLATAASALVPATETYIEVVYYLTDSSGNPIVGYSAASGYGEDVKKSDAAYTGALYVKAAFPMAYTFSAATQYNITMGFNSESSTGGYLLSNSYVDVDGNELTNAEIGMAVGDPAITSTSSSIGLTIETMGWGESVEAVDPKGGIPSFDSEGSGTSDDPYQIPDAATFMLLSESVTAGAYYQVTENLDFTDVDNYTPFAFYGTIDGNDKTISNLAITDTETGYHALFSEVYGTVSGFTLDSSCSISTSNSTAESIYVGAIAGINYGTISNCTYDKTLFTIYVNSSKEVYIVGGIVGLMKSYQGSSPVVDNCDCSSSTMSCQLQQCVDGNPSYLGGIVGLVDSDNCTIKNSSGASNFEIYAITTGLSDGEVIGYLNTLCCITDGYTLTAATGNNTIITYVYAPEPGGNLEYDLSTGAVTASVSEIVVPGLVE